MVPRMKAVVAQRYGGPEVLAIVDRPDPPLRPRDVLIDVKAASLNPLDFKIRDGKVKLVVPLAPPIALGCDVAGVVAKVGGDVTRFAPGDAVYARLEKDRMGGLAERVGADEAVVAKKPAKATFEEAAGVPLAGLTALQALREVAGLVAGQRVLIHAGAGGVGGFAVQYAHHVGALVAATCGTENVDYVTGLGADRVIDYANEDFTALLSGLDLVFDTLGGDVHRRSFAVLRPGGTLVHINAAPVIGEAPRGDVVVKPVTVTGRRALLERIADLAEHTIVTPQVTHVLPLAEAGRGYELSRGGHVRGKIVLDLAA
jgi:NADPH:quinone reductase-like Zn-dependent oxidoreductase